MTSFDLRHGLRVAGSFAPYSSEWLVALLHDSVEDCAAYIDELRSARIPEETVSAIVVLTRKENESYGDYIARVSLHPLARRVKIADLEANLARMDPEHESLRGRYQVALAVLTQS